jgi:hypothetical protein
LYLSIVRAIEEDVNLRSADKPRRLVVITDGVNEVWTEEKRRRNVEERDVIAAINGSSAVKDRRIQLHVIGFGDEAQGGATWRKSILPAIGQPNNYYDTPVREGDIEAVIRKSCNLKQFEVASGNERSSPQKVPGEIVLNDHRGRQAYEVNIVDSKNSQQVLLEGGEAINLYIVDAQSPNPRLQHKRYKPSTLDQSGWANRASPSAAGASQRGEFYIGFHPPLRQGGFVSFPISIQNGDETRFSRRPAEAWVEIAPLDGAASNNNRPLLFYDMQFEPGRPVPVLSCRTANWPAGVRRARINLFFKPDQTPTRRRQRVRDAEGTEPDPNLEVSLDGGGKVRFTVSVEALSGQNAARITVIERCASEGDLRQAKVEIEPTGGAVADRITREYFHSSDEQEVRHSFVFLDKTPADVRQYWVQVTSRKELENGAYKLEAPAEVDVFR